MRLVPGWDDKLVAMEARAAQQADNSKVVLSTYAGLIEMYDEYLRGDGTTVGSSPRMCQAFFNDDGMLSFHGATIMENTQDLVAVPFVAGGLLFCRAPGLLRDVPMDPYLDDLFVGEEILLSARLWTSGYDIFCPNENIAFHKFTRGEEPKFWENERDDSDATMRVRTILDLLRPGDKPSKRSLRKINRYGLGKERSLADYWAFAGIDVRNKRISKNFCTGEKGGGVQEARSHSRWLAACALVFLAFCVLVLLIWARA